MKKYFSVLLPLFLLTAVFAADHGIMEFEDEAILAGITPGGGKVSLSDRHYLGGRKSLRWDFHAGESLEIKHAPWYLSDQDATKKYGTPARTILTFNMYNEKALPGRSVRLEFGRQKVKKPDCTFTFNLDFTGWRSAWVVYSRDMTGEPREDMDLFRIVAPEGIDFGTFYFDSIILSSITYERYQERDLQAPTVRGGGSTIESQVDNMDLLSSAPRREDCRPLTAADLAGFRQGEKAVRSLYAGSTPVNSVTGEKLARQLEGLRKRMAETEIVRHPDGRITGRPLLYGVLARQYEYVEDRDEYLKTYLPFRQFGQLMYSVARLYAEAGDDAAKEELKSMYLLLLDHLADQGYCYGSSMGSRANTPFGTREIYYSAILVRDMLLSEKRNMEIFQTGLWHCDLNAYLDEKYYHFPNADYFNIVGRSALIAILMMDDVPEKAAYLAGYSNFISRNLAWETPGWHGGMKVDGCFFHHWGNYPSYSYGAMIGASSICYSLHGTPWAVTPEGIGNLKRALKAADLYGNPQVAPALEGRRPFRGQSSSSLSLCFQQFGEMGHRDMAAIFLRLAPPKDAAGKFPTVKPAPTPQGHFTFNYGGLGIHRYRDRMVTLKTFNRYVWGSEIYRTENRYGRYLSYGAIYILGRKSEGEEGFAEAGWDWNRWPGITAIYRPWEELACPIQHTEMRTMPENRVNGSSNLLGLYGAFGSIITEPDRKSYDPKFKAVKSVFAFGPRLIALGSDITAGSPHPVETTLFQFETGKNQRPGYFNSTAGITAETAEREMTGQPWAMDFRNNAYFVLSDAKVKFSRKQQESPHQSTHKTTTGHFNSCVIDHGVRPAGAKYEFLICLDLKPEEAAAMAETLQQLKPYTVLRQDAAAHAVADHETQVTAAVCFEPLSRPLGLLEKSSAPGYFLYRPNADGSLDLSLNTANLAGFVRKGFSDLAPTEQVVEEEERDRVVELTIDGEWQLQSDTSRPEVTLAAASGKTVITGKFRHGIPYQLHLQKK